MFWEKIIYIQCMLIYVYDLYVNTYVYLQYKYKHVTMWRNELKQPKYIVYNTEIFQQLYHHNIHNL